MPTACFYYLARKLSWCSKRPFLIQLRVPSVRSKTSCTVTPEQARSFTHILISNTRLIAYQNRTAQALSATCEHECFMCVCLVSMHSLSLRDIPLRCSRVTCTLVYPLDSSGQWCRHLPWSSSKGNVYRCFWCTCFNFSHLFFWQMALTDARIKRADSGSQMSSVCYWLVARVQRKLQGMIIFW